ncbi:NAD(P)/FAD-dependent oxidoreductase [Vibrio sp. Sgm 5]|uniref:NAD(P)/FAD-dependent oxidoreductase n=1 Tax=Vibrio sp. Sgm 5 TaxID=2994387 RepID=UPI0022498021|nr:NAD(P)/FAD-dependent oxidoreductase [Vibrio sp. Sgm 5]MCX2789542.1 NAD(P)/FAD-dependent oxidoreductase [Vibrio sp. Sgm 5]
MNTNVVVIGAGASGLKLVKQLSKYHGIDVTLVDKNSRHVWKPLMHEVATGIRDDRVDAVNLRYHSVKNGYQFIQGEVCSIDNKSNNIKLLSVKDQNQREIIPERVISFDILVIAIGSKTNDFGNSDVSKYCYYINDLDTALLSKNKLQNEIERNHFFGEKETKVTIVGGGATGVELAANIVNSVDKLNMNGFCSTNAQGLKITVLEGGERILPNLDKDVADYIYNSLIRLNVTIKTKTIASEIKKDGVVTQDGDFIDHDVIFWTAGIKCPSFLSKIEGLETNKINQITTNANLIAKNSQNIFVIGDAANCVDSNGFAVPATAQSAHQMADACLRNILSLIRREKLVDFEYKDHGAIVKLNKESTAGSLVTPFKRKNFTNSFIVNSITSTLYGAHIISILGYRKGIVNLLYGKFSQFSGNNIDFFSV